MTLYVRNMAHNILSTFHSLQIQDRNYAIAIIIIAVTGII